MENDILSLREENSNLDNQVFETQDELNTVKGEKDQLQLENNQLVSENEDLVSENERLHS